MKKPIKVGVQVGMVREEKGLSVDDLARKTGISRVTIYNIQGGANVRYETLLKICAALDISMKDLMCVGEEVAQNF